MNIKHEARELARSVMSYADRKCYGLGECGYYFETWGLDAVADHYECVDDYRIVENESINWQERKRFEEEQPNVFKVWREVVNKAEEIAYALDDLGVNSFN
jgi:hypothetical protein